MRIHKVQSNRELFQWFKAYLINSFVNSEYLLLLSGDESTRELQRMIQGDFSFPFPEDVALVSDIWAEEPLHEKSSALTVRNAGMVGRVEWQGSQWHPILTGLYNPDVEADRYGTELIGLFNKAGGSSITIVGMENDGTTAGIRPHSEPLKSDKTVLYYEHDGVKRISVSAKCIKEHFQNIILILDGAEELELFNEMIEKGSEEENPVCIYKGMADFEVLCLYQ